MKLRPIVTAILGLVLIGACSYVASRWAAVRQQLRNQLETPPAKVDGPDEAPLIIQTPVEPAGEQRRAAPPAPADPAQQAQPEPVAPSSVLGTVGPRHASARYDQISRRLLELAQRIERFNRRLIEQSGSAGDK